MFYSQFILAKKGPLGTIWIAAHLERKLRKNQVAEMDIGNTVDSILFPDVPIALRLSGHLLLGVVRIYSRQVNYLFNDCSETLGKIKQAFHSAAVDLPPEATTAPFHTITLPETFDFDELELVPDSESSYLHLNGNYVDPHVTTREQITLQDSVDHNPYLGSSQFGLDERFDDGSYSPFDLDFDEEFLAKKAHSSLDAGTSTPLPKEDTVEPPSGTEGTWTPMPKEGVVVPSVACENEITPMDIDDSCQPVKSGCHNVDQQPGDRAGPAHELDTVEMENQLTLHSPVSVELLNEHVDSQVSLRKGLDFAHLKQGCSGFNAYTPRALEACTPDLNQEYCPPDEPSTPALVDETSLPMYNELTVETAGRFSPVCLGHSDRIAASEILPGALQPQQVNPWASCNEAIRSPSGPLFPGSSLNQAAPPVEEANGLCSTQIKDAPIPSLKEPVATMSSAFPSFPSFPQQECLQPSSVGVSLGGANIPTISSFSVLTSTAAYSPQLVANPALFVTNQWNPSLDQAISSPNQTQGFAAGHYSPKTPFAVGTEPLGFPGMLPNTMVGQESTALIASPTAMHLSPLGSSVSSLQMQNVLPSGQMEHMDVNKNLAATQGQLWQSAGLQLNPSPNAMNLSRLASSVSCLQMQNVLPSGQMEHMDVDKNLAATQGQLWQSSGLQLNPSSTAVNLSPLASSVSCLQMQNVLPYGQMDHMDVNKNLAATQGQLWQSAGLQLNPSPPAVIGSLMSSRAVEECEALRSAYNMQTSSPNIFALRKDTLDDRLPGLELNRNKALTPSIEGATKDLLLPELDKTPILREETPFAAARASFLSTPSLGSEPADDDVLASILGQRTKVFKVIPTPKAQKPLKANLAPKRSKSVSRATLKRRKVDLDSVAVLHGDVIRQQLANTEDIRRERRKAPCTRREVWGYLRECEGQENFGEPVLTELPSDLHELYHDVVHGRESRLPQLSGAPEVNKVSDAKLVMGAKGSCLSDGVINDCMELDSAGESDLLAHYVQKISGKEAQFSQAVGSIQDHSSEKCEEQSISNEVVCSNQAVINGDSCKLESTLEVSREHRKEETEAEENASLVLMGTGQADISRAEEVFMPEVGTEVLPGKEGQVSSFPEAHGSEASSDAAVVEVGSAELAVQAIELERECEVVQQLQDSSMVSNFSEAVLDSKVVNQGAAMIVQHDIADSEKLSQPSSDLHEEDPHEGQLLLPSQDANLQVFDTPSLIKESTEPPISQSATVGEYGNIEGGDNKLPTSFVTEEEVNVCRADEEIITMEPERDTDCFDEDNDAPYAEIDYSSDEQEVSIQDDSGWSTRSRNIGKYLKTVFEEMQRSSKRLDQGANLGLERLLARRTRREAARMFFETLVLKTKDYIQVEQSVPYQDIVLYPKSKLMKTEF